MTRLRPFLAAMLAAALAATPAIAQSPSASPTGPGAAKSIEGGGVTAEALAFAQGQQEPVLYRLVLGAGSEFELPPSDALVLLTRESGTPAVNVAGETVDEWATSGYLVLEPGTTATLANSADTDATVLVASVRPATEIAMRSGDIRAAEVEKPGGNASCVLEYQRADNMWAGWGQPSASLGVETVRVPVGGVVSFKTDWRYEKLRNDGTTYYGSHLRKTLNRGTRTIVIKLSNLWGGALASVLNTKSLASGQANSWRDDLAEVRCPA